MSRARPQTHRSSKERRSSRTSAPATPVQEPHTAPAGAIPNHSAVTPWLRPKRIPGKNKEQRHVKREDRVPQGRGIWDGVPHNDQNNCNPLCNIDPVEPFASHSEPFKAAAHKMKKAQTTSGPGLINDGAPWRIRTVDLGIRSPLLYPTELMEHRVMQMRQKRVYTTFRL